MRLEADNRQFETNGLITRHIEELTIEVNGKSNVDRKSLEDLHLTRDNLESERDDHKAEIYSYCRNIRDAADRYQGDISKQEVLLMQFAE